MVIRELTYQLHKLEASESALVSADHHDKKSVLGIGGKNPDRSIPSKNNHTGFKIFKHAVLMFIQQNQSLLENLLVAVSFDIVAVRHK